MADYELEMHELESIITYSMEKISSFIFYFALKIVEISQVVTFIAFGKNHTNNSLLKSY